MTNTTNIKNSSLSAKRFVFNKWTPIVLGILLTIASAVISNYYIAKNNDKIGDWEQDASNVAQQIREIWENTRSLERRKDMAILLLVTDAEHVQSKAFIRDTLALFETAENSMQDRSYESIQTAFNDYRSDVIERIDDRFFQQQAYLEQAQNLKVHNDMLVNVALCFQILGLIFVLSKGSF